MIKTIIAGIVLGVSFSTAFADISQNLRYGNTNTSVYELQDFLVDKGYLNVSPTGYFGLLTLKAVKEYQLSVGVPNTGYVGPMTREKINAELAVVMQEADQAEIAETGTTTSNTPVVVYDACRNIEGIQTSVPSGMVNNASGDCAQYIIYQTPTPAVVTTPTPAPVVPVYPKPTCTLVGEKVRNIHGAVVGKVSWTSTNADYGSLGGTELPANSYINGVMTENTLASGSLSSFAVSYPGKTFLATFRGPGGQVGCEAFIRDNFDDF